ncbi:MAG: hypothetical protein F6K14_33880 [Symploca sp. SIO2C1]|nr:hypothetical protein [Symploca sp. SIO2C1]
MTKLLKEAIAAVSELPELDQDVIAKMILEELASETRWYETFSLSEAQLAPLEEKALLELNQELIKEALISSRIDSCSKP